MSVATLYGNFFHTFFSYREYLKQSVARDLRKRYKRSVLGYIWSMLHPLLMMIILAVVFSKIMRSGIRDYSVFLFCGMLPWAFFEGTCLGCLDTIRTNARLIDQVSAPKFIFPLGVALSNLVNFLLSIIPLVLVMLVVGHYPTTAILALPIVIIPLFIATLGIALILAVANVFFLDTQHLVTVVLRALYFLSPILYDRTFIPDWLVPYVVLNPMFCVIEFMRDIFYHGQLPNMVVYVINLCGALLLLALGLWLFRKADDKFMYFV